MALLADGMRRIKGHAVAGGGRPAAPAIRRQQPSHAKRAMIRILSISVGYGEISWISMTLTGRRPAARQWGI
jgi:hypothetical protein